MRPQTPSGRLVCGCLRWSLLALAAITSSFSAAEPVPLGKVQELAGGVASSVQVSYASGAAVRMAQAVSPAEAKVSAVASTNNPEQTAFYVIDRGSAGGFVVMSADDRLDPVLVIAPTGHFDPTPGTPLYDILCGDVRERIAAAEGASRSEGWRSLLEVDDARAMSISHAGIDLAAIDDLRVAPIVQSKWDQSTVGGNHVYNYYTPNNYVCGCVATAGSQIMRFHEYPKGDVAPVTRTCWVGGVATSKTMYGGTYSWSDMPLVPTSSISDTQRKAIGKLCYDVGVSIYMSWASGGSGTGGYCLKDAFLDVYGYKNAIAFQLKSGTLSGTVIEKALLANFDAGCPVEISIDGTAGGHSIVGDGYGYSRGSLYVHLNLGWGGSDDAWYNLPNIGTWAGFNVVDGAVYNIFPDGTGDLLTGRVLSASDGRPIVGATVQALDGSTVKGSTTTDAAGIYALRLEGGKTYSVVASAAGAEPSSLSVYLQKSVTTTTHEIYYYPGTGSVGNSWGNDFELEMATEPIAPTAPNGVSASDGTSTAKVRITWSASSGATYYKVYRAKSNSSSFATCLNSSVTASYYDDTSAEVGTTYWYWVKAGNSVGESGFSTSDSGWRAYAVPSAPTGVSATDGATTEGVVVTWSVSSDATSYSVWRSATSSTAGATAIANGITATSYVDTSAVVGQTYYYWVKATNQGGTSGFSASDSGYRKLAAPAAPTGVSASDGLSATEIVVSWNASASATSYSVWRGTSSSSSSATQIASGLAVTSYSDTSATAGTTYYYWVKATNSGGTSGFSSSDTGYLAVIVGPSTVNASDGSNSGYVRVTWSASQSATSYEVWRGTVNAYSQATKIASPTATSYNDSSATPGMLYYYWVRANTSAGTSAFSSSDSGFRPLSAPTGVTATTGNSAGVTVSWSSVTGATSYQIGRGTEGASAPSTTLGSSTSPSYIDATAVPGVTYTYFVRAVASAGSGAWSAPTTGSRSVPTPTNLTASDGDYADRILVTWPTLSGATSYELIRWTEDDIDSAELIATTTATSFSDTNALYGVTYYYFLRANFPVGTSGWSEAESGWRGFPKPGNVSATDGTSAYSITISWDAIKGVSYFQVWRYSELRDRKELVGTTTTTSYDDYNDIQPGVKYTYYVKAVFSTGTSALSDSDAGYLKVSSAAVAASDGISTSQISLTWNAVAGARAYLIYRSTTASTADAVQISNTSMLYYNDTSAVSGVLYYYWVRVATAIDTSDFGSSDTGYIALPGVTRVTATDGTYADRVVISWNAVSGATSYEIWRGDSDDYGNASVVATYITSLSYDDTSVPSGKKVWYWVRAVNAGVGLWGTSDSGWRKLSAPTEVTATTNQTDGVRIGWGGDSYGVSFAIYRSDSPTFSEDDLVATVSDTTSYTDSTTVPGRIYYYCLRSYSDLGESALSSCVAGNRAVAAPATVSATDGTSLDSVTITWTTATSARYYEIWRNSSMDSSTAEMLGTTNKCSWVDFDAVPGTSYYYWVRSVSSIDTSAFTSGDFGYVSTLPPTGVTASDGQSADYVRVEWIGVDGAQSYAVWRSESGSEEDAIQLWTDIVGTTYEDVSASPGKFYWYWVRPVSAAGQGVFAGPDRGFKSLSAPIHVSATSNSVYDVSVSWLWSDGATSFEIFRATTNDVTCATNVVFDTITMSSYSDTNAVPAVKYWYWVRAVAEAGVSPLSESADGFRLLATPDGVSATDGASDEYVRISWNETLGAEGYEVWRAEGFASPEQATFLASVTNMLEFFDMDATPGLWYTYWLRATSELHSTDLNTSDNGWRSPTAPSSVSASDGTTSEGVVVSWTTVDGATQYEIWRSEGEVASTNTAQYVTTVSSGDVDAYTDMGTVVGVQYWYYVRTVCVAGTGVFSLPDGGFRAISIPTDVSATDGTLYDGVYVTWSTVAGAESYEIRRVPTNELYVVTNYYRVTGTTFDDTNAVPGLVYSYWVRAVSPLSTSDYADPDNGWRKMWGVSDLAASDGTSLDAVDLSWTAPTGAVKCQIWRSTGTSVDRAIKIAAVEGGSYSDTSACHGVRYYYWVNAVSDVEGEMGNYNDGWRALYAPGNVEATDGDSTSHVRISWTSSSDATTYEILRGESAESLETIATLSSPSELVWEDTTGVAGALYSYSVRAGGTGGWSVLGAVDTGWKKLSPATGVYATDGTERRQVIVSWDDVPGAAYYRVYRADSDAGVKTPWSGWQTECTFTDTSCSGATRYWYCVIAAVDEKGTRASSFSAGDSGYAKDDGTSAEPLDLGGGISWPVTNNGDGTTTTNAISFATIEDGRLAFNGVYGAVGSTSTVQALVKTSLDSDSVYTVPATLKVVSAGTAELDLSSVWGARPSLFIIGITTEAGEVLP